MQARVFALIHDTHPASTKLLDDSIVRDGLSDERVGVRHSTVMLCCKLRVVNESGTALVAKLPVNRLIGQVKIIYESASPGPNTFLKKSLTLYHTTGFRLTL